MPDECRPPEGTEAGTWHWLERLGRPCVYHWNGNRWHGWAGHSPATAAICGYRYVAPCLTPDEAGRLVAELREARDEHAAEVDDLCMTNNRNVGALLRAQRDLGEARAALADADRDGEEEAHLLMMRLAREATERHAIAIALAKERRP